MAIILATLLTLRLWRQSDRREDARVWQSLVMQAGRAEATFDYGMIEDLPEAARRYFRFSIVPGTPLASVVELEMTGDIGLGTKAAPGYRKMQAHQLLAAPLGLVWRLDSGSISGSDGVALTRSWTRFWLLNLIPIVRVSGNPDHLRSAFGRVIAEAAFWLPSSLLPGHGVTWEGVDTDTARATVSRGALTQSVDITVDPDGRPVKVVIQRWSRENEDHVYREQPFGGYLSEFSDVDGYRLPMRVEGGNLIDTDDYFPFYRAEVTAVRFPGLRQDRQAD